LFKLKAECNCRNLRKMTLAHVGKVRPRDDYLEGDLQDRQPRFNGVESDAEIPCQFRQVDELGASGGQGPQEILEEGEVADLP
jgi:hypothetical protein